MFDKMRGVPGLEIFLRLLWYYVTENKSWPAEMKVNMMSLVTTEGRILNMELTSRQSKQNLGNEVFVWTKKLFVDKGLKFSYWVSGIPSCNPASRFSSTTSRSLYYNVPLFFLAFKAQHFFKAFPIVWPHTFLHQKAKNE